MTAGVAEGRRCAAKLAIDEALTCRGAGVAATFDLVPLNSAALSANVFRCLDSGCWGRKSSLIGRLRLGCPGIGSIVFLAAARALCWDSEISFSAPILVGGRRPEGRAFSTLLSILSERKRGISSRCSKKVEARSSAPDAMGEGVVVTGYGYFGALKAAWRRWWCKKLLIKNERLIRPGCCSGGVVNLGIPDRMIPWA